MKVVTGIGVMQKGCHHETIVIHRVEWCESCNKFMWKICDNKFVVLVFLNRKVGTNLRFEVMEVMECMY